MHDLALVLHGSRVTLFIPSCLAASDCVRSYWSVIFVLQLGGCTFVSGSLVFKLREQSSKRLTFI